MLPTLCIFDALLEADSYLGTQDIRELGLVNEVHHHLTAHWGPLKVCLLTDIAI